MNILDKINEHLDEAVKLTDPKKLSAEWKRKAKENSDIAHWIHIADIYKKAAIKCEEKLSEDQEIEELLIEILRLKPEFAKKKAQEKMKRIVDDIKRAIEKFGEDSKVVLSLRAKKKRMAHAMAESLDEAVPKGKAVDAAAKIMGMDVLKSGRLRDLLIKAGAIKSVNESMKIINQMADIITKEID